MLSFWRDRVSHDDMRACLDLVSKAGGCSSAYLSCGWIVSMPREGKAELVKALARYGFSLVPGGVYWFPACNGEPETALHWSRESEFGNRSASSVENWCFTIPEAETSENYR